MVGRPGVLPCDLGSWRHRLLREHFPDISFSRTALHVRQDVRTVYLRTVAPVPCVSLLTAATCIHIHIISVPSSVSIFSPQLPATVLCRLWWSPPRVQSLVYGEIDFWSFYDVIKVAAAGIDANPQPREKEMIFAPPAEPPTVSEFSQTRQPLMQWLQHQQQRCLTFLKIY